MADEVPQFHKYHETKVEEPCAAVKVEESAPVETTDRGVFDFLGGKKKEEEKKCEEEAIAAEFGEKVQVCEEPKVEEKKHETLGQKLHRSNSSSSSSSDEEEVDEHGEKKKKKKGLKEKVFGEKKEDTSVPVEKCDEVPLSHEPEEKKGLLDKIKDKLPGSKKTEEHVVAPPPEVECAPVAPELEGKEKKGFLEKIKDKIPGLHSKSDDEKEKEKEKEKEAAC